MAYWDGKTIHHTPPKPVKGRKGWLEVDCGCCAGTEWGGDWPSECRTCAGSGALWWHKPTGTLTRWIGGPCVGKVKAGGQP